MSTQTDRFDSVLDAVMVLTKRIDLQSETELAVKTATLNAHLTAFYPRDLVTQEVNLVNCVFVHSLDILSLFPRCRGFERIRLLNVSGYPMEYPQIEIIEIGDIYEPEYRVLRNNVAFQAGSNLNVRSLQGANGYLIDWYSTPDTRRDYYNSWIADLYPDLIIYWAAALVQIATGNTDISRQHTDMVNMQLIPLAKANFLLGQAR
jgi:hypothetical protein